jgi:hypothetical protein
MKYEKFGSDENIIDSLKADVKKFASKANRNELWNEKLIERNTMLEKRITSQSKLHDYMREHYPEMYYKSVLAVFPESKNIPEAYR